MSERVDLIVAETHPSNTQYVVERLTLDWDAGFIYIQLKGVNGEAKSVVYNSQTTPTGTTLMVNLNKANLTIRSLNQRIFDRLITDGHLVGTVKGIVD